MGRIAIAGLGVPLVAMGLATQAAPSFAQDPEQSRFQGVVIDEATEQPIADARVVLLREGVEVRSRANGTFAFEDVSDGPLTVRVAAPGYPEIVEELELQPGRILFVQFLLPTTAALLDGILVTGRPAARSAGVGEAQTAADLLAREIPRLRSSGGIVGQRDNPTSLRGVSSFVLSVEPPVYLDGVRIGTLSQALDVLNEIPARYVRNIEVLRGPAAAFLQLDGANGAILIETGRDRE
jgi:hypothetical protein